MRVLLNWMSDPKGLPDGLEITFKAKDMELDTALTKMLTLNELGFVLWDGAIFVVPQAVRHCEEVECRSYRVAHWTIQNITDVAEMLREIQPESWDAALGTSIEERDGRLMIGQTPEVHALICKKLDELRLKK